MTKSMLVDAVGVSNDDKQSIREEYQLEERIVLHTEIWGTFHTHLVVYDVVQNDVQRDVHH